MKNFCFDKDFSVMSSNSPEHLQFLHDFIDSKDPALVGSFVNAALFHAACLVVYDPENCQDLFEFSSLTPLMMKDCAEEFIKGSTAHFVKTRGDIEGFIGEKTYLNNLNESI